MAVAGSSDLDSGVEVGGEFVRATEASVVEPVGIQYLVVHTAVTAGIVGKASELAHSSAVEGIPVWHLGTHVPGKDTLL